MRLAEQYFHALSRFVRDLSHPRCQGMGLQTGFGMFGLDAYTHAVWGNFPCAVDAAIRFEEHICTFVMEAVISSCVKPDHAPGCRLLQSSHRITCETVTANEAQLLGLFSHLNAMKMNENDVYKALVLVDRRMGGRLTTKTWMDTHTLGPTTCGVSKNHNEATVRTIRPPSGMHTRYNAATVRTANPQCGVYSHGGLPMTSSTRAIP